MHRAGELQEALLRTQDKSNLKAQGTTSAKATYKKLFIFYMLMCVGDFVNGLFLPSCSRTIVFATQMFISGLYIFVPLLVLTRNWI